MVNASRNVEAAIRAIHGDDLANAFARHHANVLSISETDDWEVAIHYDVEQREAWALDHDHDITVLDYVLVNRVAQRLMRPRAGPKRPHPHDAEHVPAPKRIRPVPPPRSPSVTH